MAVTEQQVTRQSSTQLVNIIRIASEQGKWDTEQRKAKNYYLPFSSSFNEALLN